MVLWWFPFPDNINYYTFYLQLEVVLNDLARQVLCFKVEDGESDMRAGDYYENWSASRPRRRGWRSERPPHMRTGSTMTVGRWPGE